MIILGITTNENRMLLNECGERMDQKQPPDSIILGLDISHISARRIWVDAELNDEQRMLFLRSHFDACKDYCIDYECIKQDQGRELLHVYKTSRSMLLGIMKRHQLKAKKFTVETSLHGLGRALIQQQRLGKKVFHCLSFFDDTLVFSVHAEEMLIYYHVEAINDSADTLCAARRALVRYQCDDDYREIEHVIYLLFTKNIFFEGVDFLNLGVFCSNISYESCQTIIPYGLALRGLM